MPMPDRAGRVPLHYAALGNDAAELRRLIDAGDDPNQGDASGFTPVHLAAQEGALDCLEQLLNAGGDPNRRNQFGNTPLFVAVFNSRGNGEGIRLLRAHGADPFAMNDSGQTPVGLARIIANFDVAQFFVDLTDAGSPGA